MVAPRAEELVSRLRRAGAELVALIEQVDERLWRRSPGQAIWSISKEAEHVADAALLHQWFVRLTAGEKVPSRRPAIERARMASDRSPAEVAALVRARTDEGERLIIGLSDEQIERPTRPPRARNQRLAETIELTLIGHYDVHRLSIEAKLRDLASAPMDA